jgi:fumarylacetoacetase
MRALDETHDPTLRSWVAAANAPGMPFPLQNLPFGVFRRRGEASPFRGGVAIGDRIVDVSDWLARRLIGPEAAIAAAACAGPDLNALAALGPAHWGALRRALSRRLREGGEAPGAEAGLVPMAEAELGLPVTPANYTDFFCSLEHATNAGRVMRPGGAAVNANFRFMPIAYHGRASSLRVSGTPCIRPWGHQQMDPEQPPVFAPTQRLDYETELGFVVGPGNALGAPVPLAEAEDHIFGVCLLNDWSARDIQRFEYQPLGPFLGKSFMSSLSPWIVTLEALAPFRVPARPRSGPDEPAPLPHLHAPANEERGGFAIAVSAALSSAAMRARGVAPVQLGAGEAAWLYWTPGQMLVHHTSNGCDLRPADVLGSGTVSGFGEGERGCLLEITEGGRRPVDLADGERRGFLEDGDEVVLSGRCEQDGFVPIGFGECRGVIYPALREH